MKFLFVLLISFLVACNTNSDSDNVEPTPDSAPVSEPVVEEAISETRLEVKKEPVASHSEKTNDPLNDWYFSVRLYETPKTFHYRMQLQFEEIRGDDTLKIPNIGVYPEPVIKAGDEKYSCIIGFLDKDKNFREYKKVYVKNNTLKVTTLKHYAVTSRQVVF